MKKWLLIVSCALMPLLWAVEPPAGWLTDFETAKTLAVKEKKPVLVLFSGTDWCPPCKRLRRNLLDTPEFQKLIQEKCVALYIHVPRGEDEAFDKMMTHFPFVPLTGVPTIIVTDSEITRILAGIESRTLDGFAAGIGKAEKSL